MKKIFTIAASALVLAAPAAASEERPTAAELESELVCPVCETTLDTSNAPVALRMKAFIRERIAAGDTKSEIKAALVDQFGPAVLAEPWKMNPRTFTLRPPDDEIEEAAFCEDRDTSLKQDLTYHSNIR